MPTRIHDVDETNGPVPSNAMTRQQFVDAIEYLKQALEGTTGTGLAAAATPAAARAILTDEETLTGAGAVDITKLVTCLNQTSGGPYSITIANGTFTGQEKVILCQNPATTSVFILTGTLAVWDRLEFNTEGQTLMLRWCGGKWHQSGGTAEGGIDGETGPSGP